MRSSPLRFGRWHSAEKCVAWLALALMIFGARLWLIAKYGSPLPILDQWDGEAATLFKPFLEGTLRFSDLFAPHNEHRIVLSRVLALALLQLNGQWDSLFEMTINAVICAFIAVAVATTLTRWFGIRYRTFIMTAVALWWVLPYSFENALWAFQSSFYFLLFFSLVAIWGLGFHPSMSVPWGVGVAALLLAFFSMASGFFAALIVLGLIATRVITRRASVRESVETAVLCALIIALGLYFRVHVPYHEIYQAASPLVWLTFLGKCLAWPFCDTPIASLAMYAPLGTLAALYFFSKLDRENGRRIELLGATGAWVVLQAVAIAHTRAGDGSNPVSSRYMEMMALGAVVNSLAMLVLVTRANPARRAATMVAAVMWTTIVLFGALHISRQLLRPQETRQSWLRICEANIRAYIVTGDRTLLEGDPQPPIPYPGPAHLISLLDDPSIRSVLPAVVAAPLPIEKLEDVGHAFVPDGYPPELQNPARERGWGSYSERGVAARGAMQSQVFHSRLHYLQFEVAGHLQKESSLKVQSESRGQENFIPHPERADGSWRTAYVAVPHDRVRIVAEDNDDARWLGFREPRELGRYSFHSLQLVRRAQRILLWSIVLWMLLVGRDELRRAFQFRQKIKMETLVN